MFTAVCLIATEVGGVLAICDNCVSFASDCAGEADIALVLDSSGSIAYYDWLRLLDSLARMIREFYISFDGVHVAALTYSDEVIISFDFDDYYELDKLQEAIRNIEYQEGKSTQTVEAIKQTYELYLAGTKYGNRLSVRDIVFVITDGASFDSENVGIEAKLMHLFGIRVFGIGVGRYLQKEEYQQELEIIASDPDSEHFFTIEAFSDLRTIEEILVEKTCREPPPSKFYFDIPFLAIETTLYLLVLYQLMRLHPCGPEVRTARHFRSMAILFSFVACTEREVDVIFVLDASGSIAKSQFDQILNFVRDMSGRLDIDSGKSRVGFMTYGSDPNIVFYLNTYQTTQEVTRVIMNVPYIKGEMTNTAGALEMVRKEMMIEDAGDRPLVDDIIIVITDGESDDGAATIEEARLTRDAGATILSLGIGNWIKRTELEGMASHPKERNFFHVDDYDILFEVSDVLLATICDGRYWELLLHLLNLSVLWQHLASVFLSPLPHITPCRWLT